jgi:hypothetical protein
MDRSVVGFKPQIGEIFVEQRPLPKTGAGAENG